MFKRRSRRGAKQMTLHVLHNAWNGDTERPEVEANFGIFRLPSHLLGAGRSRATVLKKLWQPLRSLTSGLLGVGLGVTAVFTWGFKSAPGKVELHVTPALSESAAARNRTVPVSSPIVNQSRLRKTSVTPKPPRVESGQLRTPSVIDKYELPDDRVMAEPPEWSAPLAPKVQERVSTIKQVFIREGAPPELVWLVEVESGFDPRAYSRAGARGLFQFTSEGATAVGLSLWPRDERLDLDASARAAARHLVALKERLGTWELVLAAYNAGESRVRRELSARQATQFGAVSDALPRETVLYVDRVLALVAGREGVDMRSVN